jgi:septal ring factor EnvC (AmiA/AmiB activator)
MNERRAWTSILIPNAKIVTWLALTGGTVFMAGFGAYPIFGTHAALPDSVQALSELLSIQVRATAAVQGTVSQMTREIQTVEATLDTVETTTTEHAGQIRAVTLRIDAVEAGVTAVVHELQRIRCLARITATGQTVSPLAVDDLCP